MVFSQPKDFTLFKQRRNILCDALKAAHPSIKKGLFLVIAGFEPERHVFEQESSFYFLTGITEPAVILSSDFDGIDTLFVPEFGIKRDVWVQAGVGLQSNPDDFDMDIIKPLGQKVAGYAFKPVFMREQYQHLIEALTQHCASGGQVFAITDQHGERIFQQLHLLNLFKEWVPGLESVLHDLSPFVYSERRGKDDYELDLIYKAVQLTIVAHQTAAHMVKPETYEYQIQAGIEYAFTHTAAAGCAFPSIVATGKNTTILHYTQRDRMVELDDLVVVDIGARYGGYAADLTRTYPASGQFSPRQREIYQLVLDTQLYVESCVKEGVFLKNPNQPENSLHHLAVKFLEQRGYAQYFCHGIGHYLGLDVHDVGDYTTPLKPGDVFTIEPGIYIPEENLGVRIEDDYVLSSDGLVCLSYELPKLPDDIEEFMRSGE